MEFKRGDRVRVISGQYRGVKGWVIMTNESKNIVHVSLPSVGGYGFDPISVEKIDNDEAQHTEKQTILHVTFDNGEVWELNATKQAWERAKYYCDRDLEQKAITIDQYPKYLQDEFDFVAEVDFEMVDWLKNNCDWEDVKDQARLIKSESDYNYDDKFHNAEFEIMGLED